MLVPVRESPDHIVTGSVNCVDNRLPASWLSKITLGWKLSWARWCRLLNRYVRFFLVSICLTISVLSFFCYFCHINLLLFLYIAWVTVRKRDSDHMIEYLKYPATCHEERVVLEFSFFLDPSKLLSLSGPMSDPRRRTMDSEKRKIKNFDHILQFAKSV